MTVFYILSEEAIQYHECNKYAFPEKHVMHNIHLSELQVTKNYDYVHDMVVLHGMPVPINDYFAFVNHYIGINHSSVKYLSELHPEYVSSYNGEFDTYNYVMDRFQVDLYVDMDERYIVYSERYRSTIEDILRITSLDKDIDDMEIMTTLTYSNRNVPTLSELFPHLHYADLNQKSTSDIFFMLEEICKLNNWDSKIYF